MKGISAHIYIPCFLLFFPGIYTFWVQTFAVSVLINAVRNKDLSFSQPTRVNNTNLNVEKITLEKEEL
jgi:hypothetical protein